MAETIYRVRVSVYRENGWVISSQVYEMTGNEVDKVRESLKPFLPERRKIKFCQYCGAPLHRLITMHVCRSNGG